jgi:hypothetical protein
MSGLLLQVCLGILFLDHGNGDSCVRAIVKRGKLDNGVAVVKSDCVSLTLADYCEKHLSVSYL